MSIEAMKRALDYIKARPEPRMERIHQEMISVIDGLEQAIAKKEKQEVVAEMMKNPSNGNLYVQYTKPLHLIGAGAKFYTSPYVAAPLPTQRPTECKPLTEWLPIETAPKNSTSILIYCPRSDRKPVCEAWWAIAYEGDHGGHWQTPIGPNGRGYTILETAPTHWMPLPPPPIKAAHGIEEEA